VGHLRNAVLGDTTVRLARLAGHVVEVQNYIDDTGRQAAEAMYALERYREQPGDEKHDHFVGRLYVRVNAELTADGAGEPGGLDANPDPAEIQRGVDQVLHRMEEGVYRDSIESVVRAQLQTAARLGITYDLLVWESDILRAHLLDEALEVLERSPRVFVPEEGEYSGALVIALAGKDDGETAQDQTYRVLVRSNGIPTYTGKDVAYMMWKFGLLSKTLSCCTWEERRDGSTVRTTCPLGDPCPRTHPDRVINVVAEHQGLQQQTVIQSLEAAGFNTEARHAFHLSYGMVRQQEGRISGRRGLGSSADEVLDEAVGVARERLEEKRVDIPPDERKAIAEAIAVGAIRYLMVQQGPVKPIVFDIRDVVSFEGNTGLYLQYALVRIRAILRRAEEVAADADREAAAGTGVLTHPAERALVLRLSRLPQAVEDTLRTLAINLIADYANGLAGDFSQFYRDCPVISAGEPLRSARLRLVSCTEIVLSNAMRIMGIPLVDRM
ncbi:MAG TPA: arginine--tRNA ligase, partial [Chloroflexota bacterium]|nr:arginine--tRNA ligase [Chloroflexota bacterium]